MKLVRDKIPDIIRSTAQEPEVTVAMGGVYRELLVAKMQEELAEFVEDPCEEEAADMLEVFRALIEYHNISFEAAEAAREEKFISRGGFETGAVLWSVSTDE